MNNYQIKLVEAARERARLTRIKGEMGDELDYLILGLAGEISDKESQVSALKAQVTNLNAMVDKSEKDKGAAITYAENLKAQSAGMRDVERERVRVMREYNVALEEVWKAVADWPLRGGPFYDAVLTEAACKAEKAMKAMALSSPDTEGPGVMDVVRIEQSLRQPAPDTEAHQ